MEINAQNKVILVADDDADDRVITTRAIRVGCPDAAIYTVEDGEELMDYMHGRGSYANPGCAPRPGLILLDLNMPRKSGREALGEIKAHVALRCVPVVILSTSSAFEDIASSYEAGANAYVTKPYCYADLQAIMQSLTDFWFKRASLPLEAYV